MRRRLSLLCIIATLCVAGALATTLLRALVDPASYWSGSLDGTAGLRWAAGAAAVALGFVAWLLAAAFLQLVVDLLPRGRRIRSLADAIAPASLRTLGRNVATAAATVTLSIGPAAIGSGVGSLRPSTTQVEPSGTASLEPGPTTAMPATARLQPLPHPDPVAPPTETTTVVAPPPVATALPAPPSGVEVVVGPGDDFWHIAERTVIAAGGHASEREIATYWLRLIDLNRDRLVVPDNADLLYPGQVLRLPAVGAGPSLAETL